MVNDLIKLTIIKFETARNEADAAKFKAYMKDNFEFYGVRSPARKEIQKEIKPLVKTMTSTQLITYADGLWEHPYRELHYVAIDMLQYQIKKLDKSHLPKVEELITSNSWWDSVDALAPNIAGRIFLRSPEVSLDWIEKWNNSENMWLNRSSIIHQLRYNKDVNLELLFALIETHMGSKEFFINKASGWALRQASKFYPEEIASFIADRPNLSNLTKKEGSKYL